uniref:Uncharacterized protein n=1 Tax=Lygus hesperus TaxID=30085 RepID=A0A0A9Z4B2_LYGHE
MYNDNRLVAQGNFVVPAPFVSSAVTTARGDVWAPPSSYAPMAAATFSDPARGVAPPLYCSTYYTPPLYCNDRDLSGSGHCMVSHTVPPVYDSSNSNNYGNYNSRMFVPETQTTALAPHRETMMHGSMTYHAPYMYKSSNGNEMVYTSTAASKPHTFM